MTGFAIDIGDEGTAYEQGVNAPSGNASAAAAIGLNNLSKGLFGAMDAYSRARSGSTPTEGVQERAVRASFVERIDNLRGVKDPTKLKAGINSAMSSLESLGYSISPSEADIVFRRTGIDVSSLTLDPARAYAEAANKQLLENPSYMYLAEQELTQGGKKTTYEEVASLALAKMKKTEAAAVYLTTSATISEAEFRTSYVPHARELISEVHNTFFAALKVEREGGDLSPEYMQKLSTDLEILTSNLIKPANVSQELYNDQVGVLITSLKNSYEFIKNYDQERLNLETMQAMETFSFALLEQAKAGKIDMNIANMMISGKLDLSVWASENMTDILKTMRGLDMSNVVYNDPTQPLEVGKGDGVIETTILHTDEELEKAENFTPKQTLEVLDNAINLKLKITNIVSMDKPESRTNFLNGIGQATAAISGSNQLLKSSKLDVIFSDDVFQKLAKVKVLDPEKHKVAVAQLTDAVKRQADIFSTTMSGQLADNLFTTDGVGRVKLDTDKYMPSALFTGMVQDTADQYYNGNMFLMFKDKGRKVPQTETTKLLSRGFDIKEVSRNYAEITKLNTQFKKYSSYLKGIGASTVGIDTLMLEKQEVGRSEAGSLIPMGAVETDPYKIAWSDAYDSDEKLLQSLEVGTYYTDPDGNVRRKGRRDD